MFANFSPVRYKKNSSSVMSKFSISLDKDSGFHQDICAAYRTDYKYQNTLYNNYVLRDGKEAADSYSARAGYSEHQTGLATDINKVDTSFEKTEAFKWLINNAYKYGFILRYPKDKEEITGYNYEPWHYRYVGKEAAKTITQENLTFEEYYAYYVNSKKEK